MNIFYKTLKHSEEKEVALGAKKRRKKLAKSSNHFVQRKIITKDLLSAFNHESKFKAGKKISKNMDICKLTFLTSNSA